MVLEAKENVEAGMKKHQEMREKLVQERERLKKVTKGAREARDEVGHMIALPLSIGRPPPYCILSHCFS